MNTEQSWTELPIPNLPQIGDSVFVKDAGEVIKGIVCRVGLREGELSWAVSSMERTGLVWRGTKCLYHTQVEALERLRSGYTY